MVEIVQYTVQFVYFPESLSSRVITLLTLFTRLCMSVPPKPLHSTLSADRFLHAVGSAVHRVMLIPRAKGADDMPHPIAVTFQINGNRGKNSGNSDKFNRAQFKRM
jgi:hypothetical protein